MNLDITNLSESISRIIGNRRPDSMARNEEFNYELENNKFDIAYKKSYLRTRKWVGVFTFLLVWIWLIAMLYFVLANGLKRLPCKNSKFELSDTVIIALITTTTLNVVTFLVIVIKNLFPNSNGSTNVDG